MSLHKPHDSFRRGGKGYFYSHICHFLPHPTLLIIGWWSVTVMSNPYSIGNQWKKGWLNCTTKPISSIRTKFVKLTCACFINYLWAYYMTKEQHNNVWKFTCKVNFLLTDMDTSLKWTPEIDPYLSLLHLVDSILRWTHTRTIGLVQKVSILKRVDFILYNHAWYVYRWLQVAGINHKMYTLPCPWLVNKYV